MAVERSYELIMCGAGAVQARSDAGKSAGEGAPAQANEHPAPDEAPHQYHRARFVALLIAFIFLAVLLSSESGEQAIASVFRTAGRTISRWPLAGAFVFVALSAISAMLAFFSTAILLPIAIYVWGTRTTLFLLWIGWLAGGVCSYLIASHFGREVVTWIVPEKRFDRYVQYVHDQASFGTILLFQLFVPSEAPGLLLGLLGYPLRRYLLALALVEFPVALAAVYLGRSFVNHDYLVLILGGIAGVILSVLGLRLLVWRAQRERGTTQPVVTISHTRSVTGDHASQQ